MTLLNVTAYERSHRQAVLDLVFNNRQVYTHLDWHDTGQWLDAHQAIVRLVWHQNQIVGCMAVSEPLNATSWLRIVAVSSLVDPARTLHALWDAICADMMTAGTQVICSLVVDDWILAYLPELGFAYLDEIITLSRPNYTVLPARKSPDVRLQTVNLDDLPALLQVDHQAFAAPWQLSMMEMRQARRIAAVCRAAFAPDDRLIGYQLSTLYNQTGHLARLAVLPECQGKGVASVLLEDLIVHLQQRHVDTLTVNTQASNRRSQQLYERYSFYRNGYDLPVWSASLGA